MNLFGVRISALSMRSAVDDLLAAIAAGRRGYVCVRDAHGIVKCRNDPALRAIHNRAMMVTPDGMPLVWALKVSGHRQVSRVCGPDLMLAMFEAGQRANTRHFLYGTTPDKLDLLRTRLIERFPGARIVGTYAPPFRSLDPDERLEVIARINSVQPDIVWVGLSTPKQELWMAEMRDSLTAPALIGVGAAFDFHAGLIPRAPRVIQHSGFEWLFRLVCDPRRLWRRYAVTIPAFIGLAIAQVSGLRRFPVDSDWAAKPSDRAAADSAEALLHGRYG